MSPQITTRLSMLEDLKSAMIEEINRILPQDLSKIIVVYGAGARGAIIKTILKLLGRKLSYFIDSDKNKQNTSAWGIPVYHPDRIKKESINNIFVIVASDFSTEMVNTIESYGLKYGIHIATAFDRFRIYEGTAYTAPAPMLDFVLGYNRVSDIPGFKCLSTFPLGKQNDNPLRIVILGNSTSDPEVADPLDWEDLSLKNKGCGSWPLYFHQLLNNHGVNNLIYNGAMSAYTSNQEVLKLIRDGLILSPDIVIVLDGINDISPAYWHKNKYAKVHSHFNKMNEKIRPLLATRKIKIPTIESTSYFEDICYGLESSHSVIDEWHNNHRIMKAICDEFGIEYIAFIQPGGFYHKEYLKSCKAEIRIHWLISHLFISWRYVVKTYESNFPEKLFTDLDLGDQLQYFLTLSFGYNVKKHNFDNEKEDAAEKFYRGARKIASNCNYILDISNILNGHPDALFNGCHCTNIGNMLIANRIFQEIKNREIIPNVDANTSKRFAAVNL
jgi:lysophospholipase L1-like esterase